LQIIYFQPTNILNTVGGACKKAEKIPREPESDNAGEGKPAAFTIS